MSFSLAPEQWCACQMLPGYTGERCVPYFSPIHVRRVRPLKTGKQVLELDYVNVLYAEGVQFFSSIRFQVLARAANYLVARIVEPTSGDRVAVLSRIEFGWLAACCPGVLRAFPPARLGSPYDSSISLYLDFVFLQRRDWWKEFKSSARWTRPANTKNVISKPHQLAHNPHLKYGSNKS